MKMPEYVAQPVAECTTHEIVQTLNAAFSQYVIDIHFDEYRYERRFRAEDLDPYASQAIFSPDRQPIAILLICRRGWTSRVAGFGIAPSFRRCGLGKRIMESALQDLRDRGDKSLVLEAIDTNEKAIAFYKRLDFKITRPLYGFTKSASGQTPGQTPTVRRVDPLEVSRLLINEGDSDLPWQISGETISRCCPPDSAYAIGDQAYAVVDPHNDKAIIKTLFVRKSARNQGLGSVLLKAVSDLHPDKDLHTHIAIPSEFTEFFIKNNFENADIAQVEMVWG